MRWLRYAAILFVLTVLELEMPIFLRPFGAGPDLLVCFTLALALHAGSWRVFGLLWGIGLARDVTSLGPMGMYAILLGGGGILLFFLRDAVFKRHVFTLMALGGVFSLSLGIVALTCLKLGGGTPALGASLGRILIGALLTGAVTPLVVRGLLRTRALAGFVPTREMGVVT
jgi:rod shape-determining protein MreD